MNSVTTNLMKFWILLSTGHNNKKKINKKKKKESKLLQPKEGTHIE